MKLTIPQRELLEGIASKPFGVLREKWWVPCYLGHRKKDGKEICLRPRVAKRLNELGAIKFTREYGLVGEHQIEITDAGRRALAESQ